MVTYLCLSPVHIQSPHHLASARSACKNENMAFEKYEKMFSPLSRDGKCEVSEMLFYFSDSSVESNLAFLLSSSCIISLSLVANDCKACLYLMQKDCCGQISYKIDPCWRGIVRKTYFKSFKLCWSFSSATALTVISKAIFSAILLS